ncbi:PAS domain-containing hybrid sensor histidine kinase/response regulator [Oligoflexus tunisiensis]|uniref:PAS domain-containing hybrid sensor histidine kinase/response regulator n=1 Tax=Oligoflexus tunisiensis TaxID=708132 RepID=UPI00159F247D|nr:PAS domain S-box protein [Oligoflexus tunisiensis]
MEPHTSFLCLLLGAALFLQNQDYGKPKARASRLIRLFCGVTLVLSVLVLLGYMLALQGGFTPYGQMTFQTALSLILISLGLLLLDWEPKAGHRPSQYLAIMTMMFPLQAFVIHVNKAVHGPSYFESIRQMSIPAAITVFSLAIGLLAARPQHGFMKIVSSESLAGQVIRRLFFPLILAVPVVSLVIGSSAGVIFDPVFASSAFVMIIIAVFTVMTWVAAETVHAAERKLRASEDRFRQIFEKAPVGIAELDPHTERFLQVNAAYSRMMGYTEEELQGMTRAEAGLPVIEEGRDFTSEHCYVRKDGTSIWVSWGGAKISGKERLPNVDLVIAQDMTERRAIEEAKRLNEERLELALEASQIGFYDWHIHRNALLFDPRMSQDWGLVETLDTLEEAIALIHPDDRDLVKQKIDVSMKTGQAYMMEYRVIRPVDGRTVCVEVRGEVHKDASGQPVRFVGTCLNIDERKKSEQKLLESEARFRHFTEAMPQMAFLADAQGNILYYNRRHYDYFGLEPDEDDYEWREQGLHHPDDIERTVQAWAHCIATGEPYSIEYRLRRHDGEYRWHLGRAVPVRDSQGAIIQWLGTNTDIHEQKITSQKLQENEAKFRTIADAMPQMVWSTLADGFHDYFNKRWYEFTGMSEGSTDGDGWNGMFHPEDQERAWKVWQHSLATGDPYEIEYRLRHRSGQYRWTLGRALPIRNEQGDIVRWMGTCTDIHDQKQASEVLAASEAKLRAILSQLPVGVVISDTEGQIVTTNEAFRQIWGGVKNVGLQRYDEYEGYWFDSGKRLGADDWALARALKHGTTTLNDVVILKAFNGQEKIVLNSAVPVHTETGELTGAIAVVQDITKEKRFEAELGLAKDEAERASRAKSQFLANMSHEIRSPMNSVIGYADLLTEPGLDHSERIMYASRIKASGAHLLHIIDDILDLSKVESGHFQIEWRRFCVTDLIVECIQSMSVLAQKKKIELNLVCDTPVPQYIESDSIRFRQILMNIVGNAIKFTEKGQVRVGLRFEDKSARGPARFVVDVEDTGIGIAPEQQMELFQPFTQSDASITRKFGGTGLGLHLSRRLAQALGGDLQLTWSVPENGSCFTMKVLAGALQQTGFVTSLERQQTVQLIHKNVEPTLGPRYKVLIVDDNADNQALMKAYLRKADVSWDVASDGEKALAMATRHAYDIILMDVMMPIMDGLEATRRLRAAGYTRPIIALTAHAMKEEVEKSFAAGCDGHLSKPVDIKELLATMQRFVELSARSEQQMFH